MKTPIPAAIAATLGQSTVRDPVATVTIEPWDGGGAYAVDWKRFRVTQSDGDAAGAGEIEIMEPVSPPGRRVEEGDTVRVEAGFEPDQLRVWRGKAGRPARAIDVPRHARIGGNEILVEHIREPTTTPPYDESYAGTTGTHAGKWTRSQMVTDEAARVGIPVAFVEATTRLVRRPPIVQEAIADVLFRLGQADFLKYRLNEFGQLVARRTTFSASALVEDLTRDFSEVADAPDEENLEAPAGQMIRVAPPGGGGTTTITLTGTMNVRVVVGCAVKFNGFVTEYEIRNVAGNVLTLNANAPPDGTTVEWIRATRVNTATGLLELRSATVPTTVTDDGRTFDTEADVEEHENLAPGGTTVTQTPPNNVTFSAALDPRAGPGVKFRSVAYPEDYRLITLAGVAGTADKNVGPIALAAVIYVRATEVSVGALRLTNAGSVLLVDTYPTVAGGSGAAEVAQSFSFGVVETIRRVDFWPNQTGADAYDLVQIRQGAPVAPPPYDEGVLVLSLYAGVPQGFPAVDDFQGIQTFAFAPLALAATPTAYFLRIRAAPTFQGKTRAGNPYAGGQWFDTAAQAARDLVMRIWRDVVYPVT